MKNLIGNYKNLNYKDFFYKKYHFFQPFFPESLQIAQIA